MLLLDELKMRLKNAAQIFDGCKNAVDVPALVKRRAELDVLQQDPQLYSDIQKAQKINSEAKQISDSLQDLEDKEKTLKGLDELIELMEEQEDVEILREIKKSLDDLEKEIDVLNLSTLLKGEYDASNAIIMIHAGAGGTEAMDWVSMLYRMYRMYADKARFKIEEIDKLDGEEAGIKSVTFFVKGKNAYGFLKAEKGVHRLVRISPFDAAARRHTSFASVDVMPEIETGGAIKINPDDLRIDTYRSGGAGGQHVNKTESAIRITHLPSGIVVQCQNERSQMLNRDTAMKMLLGKLAEKRERELAEKANAIQGELKKIEWGSQIRSYVFQPYTMVKDLRTAYEDTDVDSVMNGNIEEFIFDYLRKS